MIKLNENYVVTPTGAKTLIIGDDWNKVCELEVSLIIQESSLLFSSANSRKTDRQDMYL